MSRSRKALFYLAASALCVALTAVCSYIAIPVANLKFTLQLLAVLFTAGVLPPAYACGAIAAYLVLGIAGVPVFAGFTSGIGTLTGPTGGFIIGFLPAVILVSLLLKYLKKRSFLILSGLFLAATLIVYAVGTVGFYLYMPEKGLAFALTTAVLPYIPADLLKILLASFLVLRLHPVLMKITKGEG